MALIIAALVILVGCGGPREEPRGPSVPGDTGAAVGIDRPEAPESAAPIQVRYGRIPISGPATLTELRASLGDSGLLAVLKVNRVDLDHARAGDSLVLPEPVPTLRELSPFPPVLPAAGDSVKLLIVSQESQAFGAYERGRLVRWGPVSTGRAEHPTRPGLYHTNWKSPERTSTFNEEWVMRWYWNIDSRLGISIHQYALPGRPASHACVRVMEDDALWLYEWAEGWLLSKDGRTVLREGTPVLVVGDAPAPEAGPPAWRRLPEDPAAADVSADEITAALAAVTARRNTARGRCASPPIRSGRTSAWSSRSAAAPSSPN